MTLVVLALLTAVVLAIICRGRPSTFARPTVARLGLLGIVLIAFFTSSLAKSTGVSVGWLVVAMLALAWFAVVNRGRPGIGLMLFGLALNALVIILNAGMPVSLTAIERAGVPLSRVPLDVILPGLVDTNPLREELTDDTVLPWLGEAVPLALPLRPAVASPGDVLLAAGAALFVFTGLTGLGRTVPARMLMPKERRRQRKAEKAEAAAGAAATAGGGFADGPLHDSSEDPVDPQPRTVPAGAADPTEWSGSGATGEPSRVGDGVPESAAVPVDPAAAAAEAAIAAAAVERKRLKRQLKKLKKQDLKRRREAAAIKAAEAPSMAESDPDVRTDTPAAEQPNMAESDPNVRTDTPAVDSETDTPPAAVSLEPEIDAPARGPTGTPAETGGDAPATQSTGTPADPDSDAPALPLAHVSVGASRGRRAGRTPPTDEPTPLNGADEDQRSARSTRRRGQSTLDTAEDATTATREVAAAPTPATSSDRPAG